MSASPSSSAQAAREALASRLRELRLDAGLHGRDVAALAGWHPSKASRIENAKTAPSDDDLRAWARACGVEDQAADLIAANRSAESAYIQWRRLQRTGLRRLQESYVPLYERTRHFRVYASRVVPGVLQTEDYARALLSGIACFRRVPDDSAEAASARVARSHVIREGGHSFALLMEEDVLHYRYGDAEAMSAQLGYLLAVMPLPSLSLGIIPRSVPRSMWGQETFTMFDDQRVHVELLTAKVTVTQPSEVATYARAFAELSKMAVYGAQARALITAAISSLG
ncbi:helix-turn-helix transcriptional regulator [Streptomyces olivoreticuli]|uniref:helix-turn-helix domain-containing protein n=1 Tax=Streptomyces olivoreticuli TaxID=68246 RepID=UPI00265B5018|nr:helix-turn-helix transcriptional regulator [Streptomyces olivoreticuli]WKK20978.1 helix-turn-helix transcriptional regulator [Streptomyces olivoreticuli]